MWKYDINDWLDTITLDYQVRFDFASWNIYLSIHSLLLLYTLQEKSTCYVCMYITKLYITSEPTNPAMLIFLFSSSPFPSVCLLSSLPYRRYIYKNFQENWRKSRGIVKRCMYIDRAMMACSHTGHGKVEMISAEEVFAFLYFRNIEVALGIALSAYRG